MESRQAVRFLIFDFDGTIADLPIDYPSMRQEIESLFLSLGIGVSLKPLLEGIRKGLSDIRDLEKRKNTENKVHQIMDRYEIACAKHCRPHEQVLNAIRAARSKSILYGIVSNNCEESINIALSVCELPEPCFILARKAGFETKPDPTILLEKISALGIRKEDCFIIGDRPVDKELGVKAGIRYMLINREDEEEKMDEVRKLICL